MGAAPPPWRPPIETVPAALATRPTDSSAKAAAQTAAVRCSRLAAVIPGSASNRREPVRLGKLGVLPSEHFSEVDHHLALLPGGVVLHLAVDHVHTAAVGDGLDDLLCEGHLAGRGVHMI